ncbi:hypothetical protein DICVIV_01397 [Dictyocaulus viviparus]|uniref:Uncharacterized protein n=1 Tax=Dictyocaulus viviparus TaxID=29172 RepID=A0A0D8Y6R7_DICVI|nr:hypothetical protein DICVIV_01397 [Dictyocaulus viviparus]
MSSDRRALLGVGSEVRGMRNWPLFLFLGGLVFFFYFLYVYQAQNAEYAIVRTELDAQVQKFQHMKLDFVSVKAEIERLKASEENLKTEKNKLSSELEFYSSSLRQCKLNTDQLQSMMKSYEKQLNDSNGTIVDLQQKIQVLTDNNKSLESAVSHHETITLQLKETVRRLEEELSRVNLNISDKSKYAIDGPNSTVQTGSVPEASFIHKKVDEADQQQQQQEVVNDKSEIAGALTIANSVFDFSPFFAHAFCFILFLDGTNMLESINENKEDTANQLIVPMFQEFVRVDGLNAPPQKPGDRMMFDLAAEERNKKEKPIVKSGENPSCIKSAKCPENVKVHKKEARKTRKARGSGSRNKRDRRRSSEKKRHPDMTSAAMKEDLGNIVLVKNRLATAHDSGTNTLGTEPKTAPVPSNRVYFCLLCFISSGTAAQKSKTAGTKSLPVQKPASMQKPINAAQKCEDYPIASSPYSRDIKMVPLGGNAMLPSHPPSTSATTGPGTSTVGSEPTTSTGHGTTANGTATDHHTTNGTSITPDASRSSGVAIENVDDVTKKDVGKYAFLPSVNVIGPLHQIYYLSP